MLGDLSSSLLLVWACLRCIGVCNTFSGGTGAPLPAAPPPVYDSTSDPEADKPVTQKELKGLASETKQGFYTVNVRLQKLEGSLQRLEGSLQQLLLASAGAPQLLVSVCLGRGAEGMWVQVVACGFSYPTAPSLLSPFR